MVRNPGKLIEIGAPAVLPLGLVRLEDAGETKTCLLGLTVQHPPVHLRAQVRARHAAPLQVTGARADKAYAQATRVLQHHPRQQPAQIEIELAIPLLIGLGSEALLGLSVAQALAWVNHMPAEEQTALAYAQALGLGPQHALEIWGYDRGGLLLVETATAGEIRAPRQRREIAHPEKDAWALVFVFPRVPEGTPETLEADRLGNLLAAAPYLSTESGRLVLAELLPAVDHDDSAAFGQSLMALQAMNQAALAEAGTPVHLRDTDQAILHLMRDNGARAWGQSPTGLCLYGLIQSASASVELRTKIRHHIGFFGGRVMATITDNRGAQHITKEE